MSGNSKVGGAGVYEAGDQRNVKNSEIEAGDRFNEGNPNAHLPNDSKDQRTIANRLAAEEKKAGQPDAEDDPETALVKEDATLPAKMHGNKPSRGAEIDAELQAEDEQRLREKKGL